MFKRAKGLKIGVHAIDATLHHDSVVLVHTLTVVATLLNLATEFITKFSIQYENLVLNLVLNPVCNTYMYCTSIPHFKFKMFKAI